MIDNLFDQLPALQVVLPLVGAPLCLLLRRPGATWAVFAAIAAVSLAISLTLAVQVATGGPISYAHGGWAPPMGIEYRIDALNAFVLVVVSLIAAALVPYARPSVAAEIAGERVYLFYCLLLLCLCGLLGIVATGDAFNLFVFLEISSLASYALIAMGAKRRALLAAFQYLIMGTIGGTFLLIGVGFLYQMTGTLNMMDIAERLPAVADTRTVRAALAFIVVGISLKLALVPLHLWLPGAYTYAPSAISVLLAATATKAAAYALIRFLFTVFGADYAFGSLPLGGILVPLAVVAMLYGSVSAIYADDAKALLAWSSIAQIGYIVLGIGLATAAGLTAGILHLLNHGVIKGALFMAVGALFWRLRSSRIDDLAGMGRLMPWTSAALVAGGLSLVGVPATAGFISKWYLLQAVLEAGQGWLAAAILIASLLAVIYVGKLVETLYFREPAARIEAGEAPAGMLAATWLLVIANFGLGLYSTPAASYARAAAQSLVGAGP